MKSLHKDARRPHSLVLINLSLTSDNLAHKFRLIQKFEEFSVEKTGKRFLVAPT